MRKRYSCVWRQSIAVIVFAMAVSPALRGQEQEDQEEKPTVWTASAHAQYLNKDISKGVDMSDDLPALQYGARLEHASGFSIDAGAASLLGTGGGFERWSAALGYAHAVADWLSLSCEYSRFGYSDDSLNAVANLNNAVTLGATLRTSVVNVGLSFNTYFGNGSATYYGLNLDRSYESGDVTLNPSINFSFISQTIDQKRLVSYKKAVGIFGKGMGRGNGRGAKSTTITTTTTTVVPSTVNVTGLSGVTLALDLSYDIGAGFTLDAEPAYVNSPRAELAANTNQFIWFIGVTYSQSF